MPIAGHPSITISGWIGYNERFNGEYKVSDQTKNGLPVYTHMPSVGVGAGHDWCRMWYHKGKWRIGHMHWVKHDPERCCACADAPTGPATSLRGANFSEHKGQGVDQDHGIPMQDFKRASGSISVSAEGVSGISIAR